MRSAVALLALLVVTAGCATTFTTERVVTPDPGEAAATATPPADDTAAAPADDSPTSSAVGVGPTTDSDADSTTETGTAPATPTRTPRQPSPTPGTEGKVAVSGRALEVDEAAVYRAVVDLHGREYATAPAVDLRVRERPAPSRSAQVLDSSPFTELWGFDASAVNETEIAGLAIGNRVFLYTEPVPTTDGRRTVLAHELTHVLQDDANAFQRTMNGIRAGTGNARRVYLAVVEGTATYAEERYAEEHLDASPDRGTWADYSENRTRFGAYAAAPYFFGSRYVDERVDSVAALSTVYERPPTTTEQVIHGYGPDEEPARPLATRTAAGPETDWYHDAERTRGELFVRLVLAGELDGERAAGAAAGWGADRVLSFGDFETDDRAHAWVLRWDAASEADEFDAAMRAYLDARGERTDGGWVDGETAFALRRVGDETVVVLAGPERFVDGATVEGTDGNVTVGVES